VNTYSKVGTILGAETDGVKDKGKDITRINISKMFLFDFFIVSPVSSRIYNDL